MDSVACEPHVIKGTNNPRNEESPMWRSHKFLLPLLAAALTLVCGAVFGADRRPASVVEPFTYVYDVPSSSAPAASGESPLKTAGWSSLEEGETTHRFVGCAVLMNDKIVAVLRPGAVDLDLFSRQEERVKFLARLQPVCDGSVDLMRTSLAVGENTRSDVSIEVGLRSAGNKTGHIMYELNMGAAFVTTTADGDVEKLRVGAQCRFAVLPDFFGDDIVVDASTLSVSRAELPSENFLLSMLPGGEAIVMSVSESRDNDIEISLSDATPREMAYSEISYGKKPHIWIAVLRDKGIWHQRSVALADAGKVIDLDWKMPFAALWRVDWSTVDKLNDSWEMLLQKPDGEYAMQAWFGQDPTEGQSFGEKLGARDWNKPDRKRWNPVLSLFLFPCWVDSEGWGHLQPLAERRYTNGGKIYNFSGPTVIYPLDRATTAPFSTPIDKLTVVDLVRMTLGVGPCQYILDLEGQKGNSRGVATCYARDVINAIYKEGTQLRHQPEIDEQLDAAVAFIRNVRNRIDEYVTFGHDMQAYLNEQKRLHPEHAEFLDELLLVNGRLDEFFDANRERIRTPAEAEENAAGFRKELLTYAGGDAYAKCEARMRTFTSIGGAQDGLVAACRMIVKTLRQRAGLAMAQNPDLKEIAAEIRARTQAILRNPTGYEAARH
jgi:hypothetical protein